MMNKEKNFISAVIYVHNAENRIESFLKNIIKVMEEYFEKSEIICVNDYSNDRSASIIKEIGLKTERTCVSILNMSYYHGVEAAMGAGVDLSIGDFVLEFDTTIQDFDSSVVMEVYRKSLEGYDIVTASPRRRQKFSSAAFYKMLNKASRGTYEIQTESFRILSRRVINRIGSMNRTVPYRKAVYANCGLQLKNLKYDVNPQDSYEKENRQESEYRRGLAVDTLILFTQTGYKIGLGMTMLMMFIAFCMIFYTIVVYLTSTPIVGWTTTVLFMSFAFSGLFGILTIMIKYLQIIVDLVFRKKNYSFESIEKITK